MAAGVSSVGTSKAFIILDNKGNFDEENIIHEAMHALGVIHTFEGTDFQLKQGRTDNYWPQVRALLSDLKK